MGNILVLSCLLLWKFVINTHLHVVRSKHTLQAPEQFYQFQHMTEANLWVLFLCLFLFILLVVTYKVIRACAVFTNRYCICVKWGRFCCYFRMDLETYRRERESLRRLRALRRRHRELIFGELSTYSQIPGAIPDSNNFGLIFIRAVVPPRPVREQLTSEQRRRILDRVLVFEQYPLRSHVDVEASRSASLGSLPGELQEQVIHAENAVIHQMSSESNEPSSIAIPGHEEPIDDNTCAICLDEFFVGDQINDSRECHHFFHKDCLLGWLDQHDVCPCCRRNMVTEQDWKRAMEEERMHVRENGGRSDSHSESCTLNSTG